MPPVAVTVVFGYATLTVPAGNEDGDKDSPATTLTLALAPVKPSAEAVTRTEPKFTPVTCACVAGAVAPPAMKTVGVTVNFVGSPLVSVIVTPPTGAGETRVTGNTVD